ncbi:MAG: hypothetical protein Q9187_005443 [Circinaria calcarea]
MHHIFKACTSDVITVYAFDNSFEFMNKPDYGKSFFDSTDVFFYMTYLFALVPALVQFAQNTPSWLLKIFIPNLAQLRDRQDWWINRVRDIKALPNPERVKNTIFEGILSSSLPEEKADLRLASEAQLTVFAGEGTTAYSLTCALYHLLAQPVEAKKLQDELAAACFVRGQIHPLHKSMSCLTSAPLSRRLFVCTPESWLVRGKQHTIPPGTVISMSPLDTHLHPDAFGDDAYEYRPQRWIANPKLNRYFHGFARGTRNCVG